MQEINYSHEHLWNQDEHAGLPLLMCVGSLRSQPQLLHYSLATDVAIFGSKSELKKIPLLDSRKLSYTNDNDDIILGLI